MDGGWSTYRWPLYIAWASSQHDGLSMMGLLMWWLRASSVIVLANKVEAAWAFMTQPWESAGITSTYSGSVD